MQLLAIFLIGATFGLGISLGGMADPAKVLNFFDITGSWDPSLIFVMGGALSVTALGYWVIFKRQAPVFDTKFTLPETSRIDPALIGGSVVFGIGWGIAGFCPGGAMPAIGTGAGDVFAFMAALIAGMMAARKLRATRLFMPN